jgi:hypothetical protein
LLVQKLRRPKVANQQDCAHVATNKDFARVLIGWAFDCFYKFKVEGKIAEYSGQMHFTNKKIQNN